MLMKKQELACIPARGGSLGILPRQMAPIAEALCSLSRPWPACAA
jgi:hypothetical protein